jgi:hypothetical protein
VDVLGSGRFLIGQENAPHSAPRRDWQHHPTFAGFTIGRGFDRFMIFGPFVPLCRCDWVGTLLDVGDRQFVGCLFLGFLAALGNGLCFLVSFCLALLCRMLLLGNAVFFV